MPASLQIASALSRALDDDDAAVARELRQAPTSDLLAEEVQQLREQVEVALREKAPLTERHKTHAGSGVCRAKRLCGSTCVVSGQAARAANHSASSQQCPRATRAQS